MHYLRIFLLATFILLHSFAQRVMAQHPFFYSITDDNGLPSNEVYDIEQDQYGYIWIGCDAGLYRYDGFRFTQFSNKDQNAVAISSLRFSTDKSKLFCQNFFGQIYYVAQDSLHLYADVKDKVKGHPEYALGVDDEIILNLTDSIIRYKKPGVYDRIVQADTPVVELEMAKDGSLYLILNTGEVKRYIISESGARKEHVHLPNKHLYNRSVHNIRCVGDKEYMLTISPTKYIITILQNGKVSFTKILDKATISERVYTLLPDGENMWLCTANGVYKMNLNGDVTGHFFKGEKISDMLKDREGAYWFSSLQKGIFVIPHLFMNVLNTTNSTLSDDNITALSPFGSNGILAGTYRGDIFLFKHQTGELNKLPSGSKPVNNVTYIYPYNNETILAAHGGLSVINLKKKEEHYLNAIYIRDITLSGDSVVFVSTSSINSVKGADLVTNAEKTVAHVLTNTSGKKVCYEAASNTLWFILNTGLAIMDNGRINSYTHDGKPLFCNAIYADGQGVWVGTISDGVYNIRNRNVELHLNERNGLIGNNIKCFTSHGDTLYIATNACINVRYPDGTFRYIRHANGINAKEINAMCVAPPYIYIGTLRGLFYVPTTTSFYNSVKPIIRLTSVAVDGTIQKEGSVALDYNNKDILINFSAVALKSRGRFSYHYRIRGLQDEWKHIDGINNSLRLNHLPTGKFTFDVKAVNEDGAQSTIQSIDISVSPPFWQRTIFYIIVALSVAALMGMVFYVRIKAIKRQGRIREQITNSQLTALKAQMNPHFMYNTLNSIQDLVLQKDIKNTNYYLSKYSTLMRKILDTSGSNEIDLTEETDMLHLYLELEQLRFGSDFSFSISCSSTVDKNKATLPSMLIQPFVENSIKHGLLHKKGAKKVSVSFEKNGEYIQCTITDNGIGRKRAQEINERHRRRHQSFGIKATEKRLDLINAGRNKKIQLTITDLYHDGAPSGTTVVLLFPENSDKMDK